MKKILLFGLLVTIIFLSGCNSKNEIESVTLNLYASFPLPTYEENITIDFDKDILFRERSIQEEWRMYGLNETCLLLKPDLITMENTLSKLSDAATERTEFNFKNLSNDCYENISPPRDILIGYIDASGGTASRIIRFGEKPIYDYPHCWYMWPRSKANLVIKYKNGTYNNISVSHSEGFVAEDPYYPYVADKKLSKEYYYLINYIFDLCPKSKTEEKFYACILDSDCGLAISYQDNCGCTIKKAINKNYINEWNSNPALHRIIEDADCALVGACPDYSNKETTCINNKCEMKT